MLITRFHKMIRHKIVWAIIATAVSLLFLFSFASVPGMGGGSTNANLAGKLGGQDVSNKEFRQAMFFETQLGQDRATTPEQSDALHRQTWRRLAILQAVREMGITVPDDEIGQMLHEEQGFQSNGVFDRERYRAFVRNRGVDVTTFEEYIRQNIAIQKILGILEASSWTAPIDLDRRLRNLTDLRQLEYMALDQADHTGAVTVSDADVHAFYDANQDYFKVSARVSVSYVAFPYADYAVTNALSAADVQAYYDLHTEDFVDKESTNAYALPAPIEAVREEIEAVLRGEAARFAAREHATEFVMDLAPDRAGNRPTFAALAESRHLAIHTTALFAASESLPGLDVGWEFNEAAFNLIPDDPQFGFSDSIPGANAVYVMTLRDRQPARLPEFAEVAEDVRPLAESEAHRKAFHAWADSLREKIAADVSKQSSFRDAVDQLGFNVVSTKTFTVLQSLNTNLFDDAEFVVEPLVELAKGAVGDTVTAGSRAFIVYMADREPGKPVDVYALRPQLLRTLQDFTTRMVFADWGERLLDNAQLEDFMIASTNTIPDDVTSDS